MCRIKHQKRVDGIAHFIAQKRTEWQKEPFAPSHLCKADYQKNGGTVRWDALLLAQRARQDGRWQESIREEMWPDICRTINSLWNIGLSTSQLFAKEKSRVQQFGSVGVGGWEREKEKGG